MSDILGAAPYMPEPARAPRASWWRRLWRLYLVQRAWEVRGWGRFLGAMVAAFAVWQTTRLALSPSRDSTLELATAVLSWPVADMLLGYLRLRRVRRAMRPKPNATATSFSALAAYRELARTGDVAAFDAKDLRPVTVEYTLQAMDYAEAARAIVITPTDAAIKATVIVLTDDERRGLTTNLDELGAVK